MIEYNNLPAVIAAAEAAKPKALLSAALIVQASAKQYSPIDTGRLKGSISHGLLGDNDAWIGTNVEYAGYQEYGTRYMAAQPFLRPGLDSNRQNIQSIVRDIVGTAIKGAAR